MYREYSPDIRLSHLIEAYWIADGVVEKPFTQQIIPDGCVDIIFDFKNWKDAQLVGTKTSLFEFSYQVGSIQMMGIRFTPGGITAFTHIPVFEFTNQSITFPFSETLLDHFFYEQLSDKERMQDRIAYINQYFLNRLHQLYMCDNRITHAISFILNSKGQTTVSQIAEKVCLGERHFERRFREVVGISPKLFSNVIRFRFTCQYIGHHAKTSLSDISVLCGYYDLAHMNKDFRRFGNFSPAGLMDCIK